MTLVLITPDQVNAISFIQPINPAYILSAFIGFSHDKYIVPAVSQPLLDLIQADPSLYAELIEMYIQPYHAFCAKYVFYNQLLIETESFPTSDLCRLASLQEILAIMEGKLQLLLAYINLHYAVIQPDPVLIHGIKVTKPPLAIDQSNLAATISGLSSSTLSNPDLLLFYQNSSSCLKNINWINVKLILKAYFDTLYANSTFTQLNSDWSAAEGVTQILNKPSIPDPQINSDWDAATGLAAILNKPAIPAAQVNSSWTATSGLAQILNKPDIPAAQIQSDWNQSNNALLDYIKNKPSLLGRFLDLLDVVATTFSTKARYVPIVLDDETGLDLTPTEELVTVLATFILLADVPGNYVGQAGKTLKVRMDETGLEFV